MAEQKIVVFIVGDGLFVRRKEKKISNVIIHCLSWIQLLFFQLLQKKIKYKQGFSNRLLFSVVEDKGSAEPTRWALPQDRGRVGTSSMASWIATLPKKQGLQHFSYLQPFEYPSSLGNHNTLCPLTTFVLPIKRKNENDAQSSALNRNRGWLRDKRTSTPACLHFYVKCWVLTYAFFPRSPIVSP